MAYTIENLFEAIAYCNKFIKVCDTIEDNERKGFYDRKQRLCYHIIKNSDSLNIKILDCHIDKQIFSDGKENSLYTFELECGNVILQIHQKYYGKLKELIKYKKINLTDDGEYKLKIGDNFVFNEEVFNGNMIVIDYFYNMWGLNNLVYDLCNKKNSFQQVYDSFVYFYPDFKFEVIKDNKNSTKLKMRDRVCVTHLTLGFSHMLTMHTLRSQGESNLNYWRNKDRRFPNCIN